MKKIVAHALAFALAAAQPWSMAAVAQISPGGGGNSPNTAMKADASNAQLPAAMMNLIKNGLYSNSHTGWTDDQCFVTYRGDASRPWCSTASAVGGFGYGKAITNGLTTDTPALRVDRNTSHAGGTPGGSVETAALSVSDTENDGVLNYGAAIIGILESHVTQTSVSQNLVGLHIEGRKNAATKAAMFGENIVGKDLSLTASSIGGPTVGSEIDLMASNPDDASGYSRIGLDLIMKKDPAYAGTDTSFGYGMRIRNGGGSANASVSVVTGMLIDPGVFGNILTGIHITAGYSGNDANGVSRSGLDGMLIDGTASDAHLLIRGDSTGILAVGTILNTNNATAAQIQARGLNASSAGVTYSVIKTVMSNTTAAAENGNMQLQVVRTGTMTTEAILGNGLQVGSAPTGGGKGNGTINAAGAYYANGTIGITASGASSCVIKAISGGIVTSATCS